MAGLTARGVVRGVGLLDGELGERLRAERRKLLLDETRHLLRERLRLRAGGTEARQEALGDHDIHRRGDEELLHPHVGEAGNDAHGIVRVERREDEVARERRMHRELGRLLVAYLADHDDVGVLAENLAESRGEVVPDLRAHLRLVDTLDEVLDGVFEAHDIHIGLV